MVWSIKKHALSSQMLPNTTVKEKNTKKYVQQNNKKHAVQEVAFTQEIRKNLYAKNLHNYQEIYFYKKIYTNIYARSLHQHINR